MTLVDKLKNWLNIATLSVALLGVIFVGVGTTFIMYTDVQELKADQVKIESLEKHMIEVQIKLDEMEKRFMEKFDDIKKDINQLK
jgi:uncharacterized membrane protein (DUF106 family)